VLTRPRRLPFRTLADSYYPDWVDSLRRVEQLDFDILAPGHGAMGTKRDVADHPVMNCSGLSGLGID